MSNILQDMMGMLSRKKVVTPKTDDYITVARYTSAQERMKPHPKVETELVTMDSIKTFVGGGGGGVTVTNQVVGRLVVCTGTTDELNARSNLTFDNSTNTFTVNTTVDAAIYLTTPQPYSGAGYVGRGATLYKAIDSVSGLTPGGCYAIQGTTITQSDATSLGNIAVGWMGIAITNNSINGLLLEGHVQVAGTVGGSNGDPVYLDINSGAITTTAPTAAGNIVRVMGYKVSGDKIYFKPSQDWSVIPV